MAESTRQGRESAVTVLHILASAGPESAAITRAVLSLAEHLETSPYRVRAVFLQEDGPWLARFRAAGVPADFVRWSGRLSDAGGLLRFWRLARQHAGALVHQHTGGRAVTWAARAATGGPVLAHLHAYALETGAEPQTLFVPPADAFVAVSKAVATKIGRAHVTVVYPGTESEGAIAQPEPGLIGAAGRLVPIKRFDLLLQAVAALKDELPSLRIELAGDGSESATLRAMAEKLGIAKRVTFLGWRDDVRYIMARWNLFVLPSEREAFGIAALDAMSCGVPVVGTRVGGIPELVEDGRTGILVEPGNLPALAAAIRELLTNDPRRNEMRAQSRSRATQVFPALRTARELRTIYDRLALESPKAAR
jgi:glycosyltransferase involved in cell wall biosynthesis